MSLSDVSFNLEAPKLTQAQVRRAFGSLLAQTARLWRRAIDRELQPHGLTEATWLPLLRLSRSAEAMRQKDLAASLSLDNSSVVRLLDNLQSLGLVDRQEGSDRRAKAIHLTESGKALVERVEGIALRVRESALAGIPDADVEKLVEVLQHVASTLTSMTEETAK